MEFFNDKMKLMKPLMINKTKIVNYCICLLLGGDTVQCGSK